MEEGDVGGEGVSSGVGEEEGGDGEGGGDGEEGGGGEEEGGVVGVRRRWIMGAPPGLKPLFFLGAYEIRGEASGYESWGGPVSGGPYCMGRNHAAASVGWGVPAMRRPRCSRVTVAGVDDASDAAFDHDGDAVGEVEELFELGGDEEDGGAGGAGAEELGPDGFDGTYVEAAGGLFDYEHLRGLIVLGHDFATEDDFLEVAAREVGGWGVDGWRGGRRSGWQGFGRGSGWRRG